MKLTIIPVDGAVYVDGSSTSGLLISFPNNVHALQWSDSSGWIEFNTGEKNQDIEELPTWAIEALSARDAHIANMAEEAVRMEAEALAAIPTQVTMRQARLALLGAGLLSGIDAAINSLSEPDKSAAKIEWEYAAVVQRDSGLVPAMAAALGMTEAQIDQLFITASTL